MFAYCGNNPVCNSDATGMLHIREGTGGSPGYVGSPGESGGKPVSRFSVVWPTNWPNMSTAVASATVVAGIALLDFSIDSLRRERFAIRKRENVTAVAITTAPTRPSNAKYYGADIYGGQWKKVTPPMTYEEALLWTTATAASHVYGKGANWGLYTLNGSDAYAIAWELGCGFEPIHDPPRKGEYRHYHIYQRTLVGEYKGFHSWYGSIYRG